MHGQMHCAILTNFSQENITVFPSPTHLHCLDSYVRGERKEKKIIMTKFFLFLQEGKKGRGRENSFSFLIFPLLKDLTINKIKKINPYKFLPFKSFPSKLIIQIKANTFLLIPPFFQNIELALGRVIKWHNTLNCERNKVKIRPCLN